MSIVSAGQVHASECGLGDSDFPFCVSGADDQENENEEGEETENQGDDQENKNRRMK